MSTIKPIVYDAANARLAEQTVVIPPGYIDGLNLVWNSGTSLSVTSGSAYIEGAAAIVNVPAALTLSGLSLTASTWYHVYLYLSDGTPAIECVTDDPATAYSGTARSKTGDASRRYLGSVKTNSDGAIYNFAHKSNFLIYREDTAGYILRVLSGGMSTTDVSISCAEAVPITATTVTLRVRNTSSTSGLRIKQSDGTYPVAQSGFTGVSPGGIAVFQFPLDSSRQLIYSFNITPDSTGGFIDVLGYVAER